MCFKLYTIEINRKIKYKYELYNIIYKDGNNNE